MKKDRELAEKLAQVAKFLKEFCDERNDATACMSCPWRDNCAVEPYAFVTNPDELMEE